MPLWRMSQVASADLHTWCEKSAAVLSHGSISRTRWGDTAGRFRARTLHCRSAMQPFSAAPFIPRQRTLSSLRQAAGKCQGCPLYKLGTQTVFGEGKSDARLVMVG